MCRVLIKSKCDGDGQYTHQTINVEQSFSTLYSYHQMVLLLICDAVR